VRARGAEISTYGPLARMYTRQLHVSAFIGHLQVVFKRT